MLSQQKDADQYTHLTVCQRNLDAEAATDSAGYQEKNVQ